MLRLTLKILINLEGCTHNDRIIREINIILIFEELEATGLVHVNCF